MEKKLNERNSITFSPGEIREALERVHVSPYFANSSRLSEFLRYIVEEQIEGRGGLIKGKTIAVHVYKRELDPSGGAQNLVRVEAQRLRRSLEEYYTNEGKNDALKIVVKSGSYRPTFERAGLSSEQTSAPIEAVALKDDNVDRVATGFWTPQRAAIMTGICFIALVFAVASTTFQNDFRTADNNGLENDSAELAALRERSMTSVQSTNIAYQTRGAFFPLFDVRRQMINLESFRHASSLDPELPDGYAGTAQVLALLSILSPDARRAEELLSEALENSTLALEIDPTDAWANSARAWVLAVAGDYDEALRRARIALQLAPDDGHSLDLVGISSFLAGDALLSAEASDPLRARNGAGRFGANNIWGVAQLTLGNYDATIDAFSTSAQRGAPVSAPTLLLLATAHKEKGDVTTAHRIIDEMFKTWPDFPASAVVDRFFDQHPETRGKIFSALQSRESQTQ